MRLYQTFMLFLSVPAKVYCYYLSSRNNRQHLRIRRIAKSAIISKSFVDYLVVNSSVKSKQSHRYPKYQVDSLKDIFNHLLASAYKNDLLSALFLPELKNVGDNHFVSCILY